MTIDEFYELNREEVQRLLKTLHDEAVILPTDITRRDAIRQVINAYKEKDPHWWTLWRSPEIVGGGLCMVPYMLKMSAFYLGFDMEFDPARVADLDDDSAFELPTMCKGARYDDAGKIMNAM